MKALDKKLIRDLSRWRGQIIAIALVFACGIASFVSMLSAYESLKFTQATYQTSRIDRFRAKTSRFISLRRDRGQG